MASPYGTPAALALFLVAAPLASQITTLHDFLAGGLEPHSGVTLGPDGMLYGTTLWGGLYGYGAIYRIAPDGSGLDVLHSFNHSDGSNPFGAPALDANGNMYGTTGGGGDNGDYGTIWRLSYDGTDFETLHSFDGTDGRSPLARLTWMDGNTLYGTARFGGTWDKGTIFRIDTDGSGFAAPASFGDPTSDKGWAPYGELVLYNGFLYGTTYAGGDSDEGILFSFNPVTSVILVLRHFTGSSTDGGRPVGGLFVRPDLGYFYGTTSEGGPADAGTVFRVLTSGVGFQLLRAFIPGFNEGGYPYSALHSDASGNLYGSTYSGGNSGLGTVFRIGVTGANYQVLHHFSGGANAAGPAYALAVAGGVVYGTATNGGTQDQGALFRVGTDGSAYSVVHTFRPGGCFPTSRLTRVGGDLYGVTLGGGLSNRGTIFRMGADGNGFTTLHEFGAHPDGAAPQGGLTFVAPDWLYGTTSGGGQNFFGTIFRIRTSGADYSVRASFGGSNPPLGSRPNDELVDDGSGVLYGSTTGGALGEGVLFRFHLATDFIELLEAFQPPHGNRPSGSPVRVGNALYGTTQEGGAFDEGTLYRRNLEPPFDFETLYSFRDAHGEEPLAALTHEGGPWIYGTTGFGGENFAGTVFRFTPASGIPDTLLDFDDAGSGGALPRTSLVAGAGGFFGTTSYGGAGTRGQIYWVHRNGGGYRVLYDFATEESGNGELLLDGKRLVGGISRGGTAGHGLIYALPVSLVFLDDFESGDDSTWSLASP